MIRLTAADFCNGTGTASAGPAAIIQMGPISMVNGRVLFSDRFIQPNYTANLSDLTGKLSQFSSQPANGVVQLADLERRFQRRQADALLEAGVRLADPARFDLRGSLACGQDVDIDINCVFDGRVVLGNGVRIGANCCIANAVIEDGAVIHPNFQPKTA